jgi:hypothetical protein
LHAKKVSLAWQPLFWNIHPKSSRRYWPLRLLLPFISENSAEIGTEQNLVLLL